MSHVTSLPNPVEGAQSQAAEEWLRLLHDELRRMAEAMRRILVERARRRSRLKRGAHVERADDHESEILCPMPDDKLLQVNDVPDALEEQDPMKVRVVKLRSFAGLENKEIGALLGVNEKAVRRHWQVAKVLLFQLIRGE